MESMVRGTIFTKTGGLLTLMKNLPASRNGTMLLPFLHRRVALLWDMCHNKSLPCICYVFLGKHNSSISCKITGSGRYSHDLPQGGMEVPCILTFEGQNDFIRRLYRKMLTKLKIGTPTLVKVISSTPPHTIYGQVDDVMYKYMYIIM